MVSVNHVTHLPGTNVDYIEGGCLSTDDKPLSFATGSILVEVDTGDVYMFDGTAWVKQLSLQG